MPPTSTRDSVRVCYVTAACDLGRVAVAATPRGVCAVALADTDDELTAFLREVFPTAELRADAPDLQPWLAGVLRTVEGNHVGSELPLDVRATPFQHRVWGELRLIPFGQTRTYKQLATSVGQPTAVRAVARACATNPVAVVVPCHRVVGSDGSMTGYRWGVARKRELLKREREGVNNRVGAVV